MFKRPRSHFPAKYYLYFTFFLFLCYCSYLLGKRSAHFEIENRRKIEGSIDAYFEDTGKENAEWIETISWSPRVFLYHNILTKEECERIISLGEKYLTRSEVVSDTPENSVSSERTSYGTFLTNDEQVNDEVVTKLQKTIALWTHIPEDNGEAFYLLRYDVGQQYKPHHDFFEIQDVGDAGNRMASVVVYLQSPEEGGETIFPNAQPEPLTITPKQGNAILFWDLHPDGDQDQQSLHGGLPVIKGTKWALTKWLHQRKYS